VLERWGKRNEKESSDRTRKHFFVSAEEIRENKYDLSINRYKELVYEEEEFEAPKEILEKIIGLEKEIMKDMQDLKVMLG